MYVVTTDHTGRSRKKKQTEIKFPKTLKSARTRSTERQFRRQERRLPLFCSSGRYEGNLRRLTFYDRPLLGIFTPIPPALPFRPLVSLRVRFQRFLVHLVALRRSDTGQRQSSVRHFRVRWARWSLVSRKRQVFLVPIFALKNLPISLSASCIFI